MAWLYWNLIRNACLKPQTDAISFFCSSLSRWVYSFLMYICNIRFKYWRLKVSKYSNHLQSSAVIEMDSMKMEKIYSNHGFSYRKIAMILIERSTAAMFWRNFNSNHFDEYIKIPNHQVDWTIKLYHMIEREREEFFSAKCANHKTIKNV